MDFDLLRQELSETLVESPQERYHLNWPGKREALLAANAPIAKTLRPCREESVAFDTSQTCPNFSQAGTKLRRHIYDYVVTDSQVERDFVRELDTAEEVVVYAKLPRGFHIPTPVGDYNPDWAISFREGTVRHIYFVAETKGSMSSLELRAVEATRIECARRFFEAISQRVDGHQVRYDVVTGYGKLMELVGGGV